MDTEVLAHNTKGWKQENRAKFELWHKRGMLTEKQFDRTATRDDFVPLTRDDFVDMGVFDAEKFAAYLEYIHDDPVRLAAWRTDQRRIKGDPRRLGIAARAAAGIPMLNANPTQIFEALEGKTSARKMRTVKGKLYKRIVVKPDALYVGKTEGWMERVWTIHQLKYASGLVIVDDQGNESPKIFPQWSDIAKAIRQAGWRVVR
jgi:hypothetical protein